MLGFQWGIGSSYISQRVNRDVLRSKLLEFTSPLLGNHTSLRYSLSHAWNWHVSPLEARLFAILCKKPPSTYLRGLRSCSLSGIFMSDSHGDPFCSIRGTLPENSLGVSCFGLVCDNVRPTFHYCAVCTVLGTWRYSLFFILELECETSKIACFTTIFTHSCPESKCPIRKASRKRHGGLIYAISSCVTRGANLEVWKFTVRRH